MPLCPRRSVRRGLLVPLPTLRRILDRGSAAGQSGAAGRDCYRAGRTPPTSAQASAALNPRPGPPARDNRRTRPRAAHPPAPVGATRPQASARARQSMMSSATVTAWRSIPVISMAMPPAPRCSARRRRPCRRSAAPHSGSGSSRRRRETRPPRRPARSKCAAISPGHPPPARARHPPGRCAPRRRSARCR